MAQQGRPQVTRRLALVTGASGAIGSAISHALADAGHEVWVHANRNLDQAEAVAATIRATGGAATAIAFDVTDADATEAALQRILAHGTVQILVNTPASTMTRRCSA